MEARCRHGLRLDDAAYLARQVLPANLGISRETIRRYETGLVPESSANPLYVAALAVVYEVTVSDLSVVAASGIDTIFRQLLSELQPVLKAVSSATPLTN